MSASLRMSNDVGEAPRTADSPRAARSVLLGVGNTLLMDDGVGIQLIDLLRGDPVTADYDLLDGGTLSFSLLTYLEGANALVAVDAANLHAAAGTVRVLEGAAMDAFVRRARGRSVHEIGLADLLDMALLHGCLPVRRALVCIQPLTIDWGASLSLPVTAALPGALAEVRSLLRRWAG
jgi:hydrogenase maturation protease